MAIDQAPLTTRDARRQPAITRQFVRFAFHRVDPAWRLRSDTERAVDREELVDLLVETGSLPGVVLRTYSLVGTRGDADFMLWLISDDLDHHHRFSARLNRTRIAGHLTAPYHYFAMTKRSMYVDRHEHEGQEGRSNRMVIVPGTRRYLFVYPFVKTRAWYRLPKEERQRQMTEHIAMGHRFPSVKINTTYSFGLDDQEFVVAFETANLADFLDLVMELRETQASAYTLRDTPTFTCLNRDLGEALEQIG